MAETDLLTLLKSAHDEALQRAKFDASQAEIHVHDQQAAARLARLAQENGDPALLAVANQIGAEEEEEVEYFLSKAEKEAEQALAYENEAQRIRIKDSLAEQIKTQPHDERKQFVLAISTMTSALGQARPTELKKLHAGEEIRDQVVALGNSLTHDVGHLSNASDPANVRRVVEEVVAFISGVLTIADHVKGLIELVGRFAATFEPFAPLLPEMVKWPF
jgi:hypothetical protein